MFAIEGSACTVAVGILDTATLHVCNMEKRKSPSEENRTSSEKTMLIITLEQKFHPTEWHKRGYSNAKNRTKC